MNDDCHIQRTTGFQALGYWREGSIALNIDHDKCVLIPRIQTVQIIRQKGNVEAGGGQEGRESGVSKIIAPCVQHGSFFQKLPFRRATTETNPSFLPHRKFILQPVAPLADFGCSPGLCDKEAGGKKGGGLGREGKFQPQVGCTAGLRAGKKP